MKTNYDFGRLGINEANKEEYIEMLGTDRIYFVPSKFISKDKVSIEIEYTTTGLYSFEELTTTDTIFKLQAMRSLVDLVLNTNELMGIDLEPENLYFEQNTKALQLTAVLDPKEADESQLVNQIKALTGSLFMKEDYDSIHASNGELLSKNSMLQNLAEVTTIDDLKTELNIIIETELINQAETKVSVDKGYVNKVKRASRIKSILIVILLVASIFLAVIYIPNRTSQLHAIDSYEAASYEDVLADMKDTNVNTMSPVMKYVMAESTIKLSQLSDTQKDNILYNLSPSVEENILDFWVYVGQGNLEQAYDQSIKNNDAQQKAYALLLLIDQTQNDTSLKTDEKESLLSTYQGELDSITGSMETDKESK